MIIIKINTYLPIKEHIGNKCLLNAKFSMESTLPVERCHDMSEGQDLALICSSFERPFEGCCRCGAGAGVDTGGRPR